MANIPFWDNDPVSWDNVYLGGEVLPGSINRVENLKAGRRKTDIKTAPGSDGASISDQGYEPATFSIVIEAYQENELSALADFIKKIQATKSRPMQAYTVVHPMLAACSITSLYILDISLEKKDGVLVAKLSCIEFLPLRSAKSAGRINKTGLTPKDAVSKPNQQTQPEGAEAARPENRPSAKVKAPKP